MCQPCATVARPPTPPAGRPEHRASRGGRHGAPGQLLRDVQPSLCKRAGSGAVPGQQGTMRHAMGMGHAALSPAHPLCPRVCVIQSPPPPLASMQAQQQAQHPQMRQQFADVLQDAERRLGALRALQPLMTRHVCAGGAARACRALLIRRLLHCVSPASPTLVPHPRPSPSSPTLSRPCTRTPAHNRHETLRLELGPLQRRVEALDLELQVRTCAAPCYKPCARTPGACSLTSCSLRARHLPACLLDPPTRWHRKKTHGRTPRA